MTAFEDQHMTSSYMPAGPADIVTGDDYTDTLGNKRHLLRKDPAHPVLTRHNAGGLEYLSFPMLDDTGLVKDMFTTRLGGISTGHLASLNLSTSKGDEPENVRENFNRIASVIQSEPSDFVLSDQTHTTNVMVVTRSDAGKGLTRKRDYHDIDGLITNEKGLVLSTVYADCVPLYFLDPVNKVIGLSHSGRKGTVSRMGVCTVDKMHESFGSDPADILACIGPSICVNCYEVGPEVADEFIRAFPLPSDISHILVRKPNGKYLLDLWNANKTVLKEAGILPEHIECTDICTCCNPEYLFSHRASKGLRGNIGAFMKLI